MRPLVFLKKSKLNKSGFVIREYCIYSAENNVYDLPLLNEMTVLEPHKKLKEAASSFPTATIA
jgi:hypothetical protein